MHAKIKRLEELVDSAVSLIRKLEAENSVLSKKVELFAAERQKYQRSSGSRDLEEFKARIRKRLSRIYEKINLADRSQPELFDGKDYE